MPRTSDIDPLEILGLLTHVNLVDVVRGADGSVRLRHRLEGTDLVERFRRSSTGTWFDENYEPEHLAHVMPNYLDAIENRRPNSDVVSIVIDHVEVLRYERIICPLAADDGEIEQLFLVFGFFKIVSDKPVAEGARLPLHRRSLRKL